MSRARSRAWPLSLVAALAASACSFVDDFDRFSAKEPTEGSESDSTTDEGGTRDGAGEEPPGREAGSARDPEELDASRDDTAPARRDAGAGAGQAVDLDAAPEPGPGAQLDGRAPEPDEREAGNGNGARCAMGCDDGDPCTNDRCVDKACSSTLIDADGDTFAPFACASGSAHKGGDCDDKAPSVFPGAPELCDGVDNNCSGGVDEGFDLVACYPDRDTDGYPDLDAPAVRSCACKPDERRVDAEVDAAFRAAQHDCFDAKDDVAKRVFPGQSAHFEDAYRADSGKLSFDYDCDGLEEPQFAELPGGRCLGLLALCAGATGFEAPAPACGVVGTYAVCEVLQLGCGGTPEQRKQRCK